MEIQSISAMSCRLMRSAAARLGPNQARGFAARGGQSAALGRYVRVDVYRHMAAQLWRSGLPLPMLSIPASRRVRLEPYDCACAWCQVRCVGAKLFSAVDEREFVRNPCGVGVL